MRAPRAAVLKAKQEVLTDFDLGIDAAPINNVLRGRDLEGDALFDAVRSFLPEKVE